MINIGKTALYQRGFFIIMKESFILENDNEIKKGNNVSRYGAFAFRR